VDLVLKVQEVQVRLVSKTLFALLTLTALVPAEAAFNDVLLSKTPRQLMSKLRCKPQVEKQLKTWKMSGEWVKQAMGGNNQVRLDGPTATFGKWVRVELTGTEPRLYLLGALAFSEVSFDQKCQASLAVKTHPSPQNAVGKFNDAELQKQVKANKKGMVYVWSANMPWSVEGIASIRETANKMNIPLTVLMSPSSDISLTAKLVKEKKVTLEDARTYHSVELVMRGMSLHDPSLLIWKNGKLARWARPGYETPELYERWLQKASM